MGRKEQIEALKAKLEDLKERDPSHCSGSKDFVAHSISPKLFQEIEDIELEIERLEQEIEG